MDHYIVKIYRRKRKQPKQVVGIVEDVATGGVQTFHNTDELEVILGAAPKRAAKAKSSKPRRRKPGIEPNA